jgi:glycosyltransferase involved in cell wall biosynthesis
VRILQVTPYFAPAWAYGGPPRVMHDLAAGLVARGHEVDVLTTDVLDAENRATPREDVLDGIRVRRLPNVSNSLAWRTKKYLPRGLLTALARSVATYDAVHVTDTRTFLTAAAHVATATRRVPLCLSAHGSLPESTGLRGAVKRAYDLALVRPMVHRAALLLAQTPHEERLYEAFGGRQEAIRLLPLPLPALDGDLEASRGTFRARLGLPESVGIVLFLGRINRLKGLDVLARSLAPLLGRDLVLAVVGRDDGQLDDLRREFAGFFADGRIRFAGPLYGTDRFGAYLDADVFCLTPAHWEETSVAALEAAACSTPVVVSEQADLPGLEQAGGGFVVPLRDEAIRRAVQAALAGGAAMGDRARAHVRAQHAPETVVERLESYLLEVAGR